ncbi:MAG: hypothetical protein VB021_06540 [Oscillospiraceae bacterium]|nr:hypothetical protein [Oscillospiraceae bacterium]
MLTIRKVRDDCADVALAPGEIGWAAYDERGLAGWCVCRMSDDLAAVRLLRLHTRDGDLPLADGLARSAVADVRDIAQRAEIAGDDPELRAFASLTGAFEDNIAKIEKIFKTCC